VTKRNPDTPVLAVAVSWNSEVRERGRCLCLVVPQLLCGVLQASQRFVRPWSRISLYDLEWTPNAFSFEETSCSGCESERVEQNDVDVSKDPGHGPQTLSSHGPWCLSPHLLSVKNRRWFGRAGVTCHLIKKIVDARAHYLVGDETTIGKEDVVVPPLRALTSLKWPYVPETSAYADPLKRDDPKPLHLAQYSAIGSSSHHSYILVAVAKIRSLDLSLLCPSFGWAGGGLPMINEPNRFEIKKQTNEKRRRLRCARR
jgi:hypothetical protein